MDALYGLLLNGPRSMHRYELEAQSRYYKSPARKNAHDHILCFVSFEKSCSSALSSRQPGVADFVKVKVAADSDNIWERHKAWCINICVSDGARGISSLVTPDHDERKLEGGRRDCFQLLDWQTHLSTMFLQLVSTLGPRAEEVK